MITIDESKVKEIEQRLMQYPKKAPLVISRALNRAAANVKTNASKKVREEYVVKAKDVNATMTIKRQVATIYLQMSLQRTHQLALINFEYDLQNQGIASHPKY